MTPAQIGPFEGCVPLWRVIVGVLGIVGGYVVIFRGRGRWTFWCGGLFVCVGSFIWLTGHADCKKTEQGGYSGSMLGFCVEELAGGGGKMTKEDYCLYVPYVNGPALLRRAVGSVRELGPVVVNNSGIDIAGGKERVFAPPVPLTFAQTMNYGLKQAGQASVDYCLFLHADAEAAPGTGDKLLQLCHDWGANNTPPVPQWGAIFTNYDAFVALSVAACRAVGPWDTNLPQYFSDNDYYHRLRLAGYPTLDSGLEVRHEPSQTIKADARLAYINRVTFPLYEQYYAHKWGGGAGHEIFTEPWDGRCPK